MAYEMLLATKHAVIHEPRHDLESFYWVLLWVVLRHTDHNLGQDQCEAIFVYGDDKKARTMKAGWLSYGNVDPAHALYITNNRPLTYLMYQYRKLVQSNAFRKTGLDYDSVLQIFDVALGQADHEWPTDDRVECTLLDKPRTADARSILHQIIPIGSDTRATTSEPGPSRIPSLLNSMTNSVVNDVPAPAQSAPAHLGPQVRLDDGSSVQKRKYAEEEEEASSFDEQSHSSMEFVDSLELDEEQVVEMLEEEPEERQGRGASSSSKRRKTMAAVPAFAMRLRDRTRTPKRSGGSH